MCTKCSASQLLNCYTASLLYAFSCIATCIPLTVPDSGSVSYDPATLTKGEHGVGVVATFSCESGFDVLGSDTSTCLADESWENIEPICQGNLSSLEMAM